MTSYNVLLLLFRFHPHCMIRTHHQLIIQVPFCDGVHGHLHPFDIGQRRGAHTDCNISQTRLANEQSRSRLNTTHWLREGPLSAAAADAYSATREKRQTTSCLAGGGGHFSTLLSHHNQTAD
ncbi:hypothetical protein CGCF413_v005508 [Colletotrichum fructicola]|nr:hypothetical protein CGCF413_v005508 [Colletotrichum fructicola]